jgi:DnaK suppressor protein
MNAHQLRIEGELKLALELERGRLEAMLVRASQAEQDLAQSEHQESSAGGSQADVASDVTEQTLEASLERNERERYTEVEAALQRIAQGQYGICETCQQTIALARLRAIPWTRECVVCAKR